MNDVTQDSAPAKTKKAPTEYIKVAMEDGRTVEFPVSRKTSKDYLYDADGKIVGVRFDFVSGATRSLMFAELNEDVQLQSCGHGILQKGGDEYSGVKEVDDMVLAVEEIFARLRNGEWAAAGKEAGDSMAGASIVIRAVLEDLNNKMSAAGKPLKDTAFIKAFLQGKLDAAKGRGEKLSRQDLYNTFRTSPSTGPIIRRLEEEKLVKSNKADANVLLEEMGAA
jgi:hypothetical protein